MKDLLWSQTLSVEVKEVDDDHRRLVDLFNMLNHAVNDGSDARYIGIVMEELVNCTAWHFSHEERLMLEHGYPGLEAHRQEHLDLMDTVRDLQREILRTGRLEEAEFEVLEQWLTGHILADDMKFGEFLLATA